MGFQPFLVGDYRAGLQTNLDPWKLPRDAFQKAENFDMRDGVMSRRRGYRHFARMTQLIGSIENITSANPGVVTTDSAHGLSNGDEVRIDGLSNMTEANNQTYVVSEVTATTFELDGVDTSTGYTAFNTQIETITGITQANPGVVTTSAAHGLSNGARVRIESVAGMTEVNDRVFTIAGVTATTFQLQGENTSGYTAYTSGGTVSTPDAGKLSLLSQDPIMGIIHHRDSNNDEDLLIADLKQLATWNPVTEEFTNQEIDVADISGITQANPGVVTTSAAHGLTNGQRIRLDNVVGMTEVNDKIYRVANKTSTTFELEGEDTSGFTAYSSVGDVYLLDAFSGDNNDFVHWENWKGAVYMVNGNDRPLKWDGTNLTRVVADFSGGTTNGLSSAKFVFAAKERLIFLKTIETNNQFQRARWSKTGNPDVWHDQNSGGTGGFVDAPTGEPIVAAAVLQDNIIVFFRKSTWMLRYTGNGILPFRWEKISSTRKIEASFGTTQFDKFVTAVGTTGIIACNGTTVDRLDLAIPDQTRQFNADLIPNIYAYKFEETERVWMTYADNAEETINRALIYHFEEQGWTTFNFLTEVNITGVTEADPGVVTTSTDHGLNNGDLVVISDVSGMTELNDNEYVVANKTDKTFELQGVDTSGFTTYTSGGLVTKQRPLSVLGEWSLQSDDKTWADIDEAWVELYRKWNDGRFQIGAAIPLMGDSDGNVWELDFGGADRARDTGSDYTGIDFTSELVTKRLNPFVEQGLNAELGYVDILFSRDSNATVDIECFVDSEGSSYAIDGQSVITYDLDRDRGSDTRIWKRIYPNATGAWHEMSIKTTGQDKYVDIHAMIFWFRPAGRLELHA